MNSESKEEKIIAMVSFVNEIEKNIIFINPILFQLLGFTNEFSQNNVVVSMFNNNL